jgi:hypothetical protein
MENKLQQNKVFYGNLLRLTSLTALLLSVFPFFLLFAYTGLMADDYSFATNVLEQGFLQAQYNWYTNWTGRYTSSALISVAVSSNSYGMILFLLQALLYLSLVYFLSPILSYKRFTSITLAGVLLTVFLLTMPDVSEGIYWMSGSITYIFPGAITLFLLGVILRFSNSSTSKRVLFFIVGMLLSFLIIGSNEVALVFLLTFLGSLLFLNYKTAYFKWTLGLFLICIAFSAIVILAPGNFSRVGIMVNQKPLIYHLVMSIVFGVSVFSKWVLYSPLFIISIIYLAIGPAPMQLEKWLPSLIKKQAWLFPLWIILALSLCTFPSFWAQNNPLPDRALNYLYLIFLPFWFIFLNLILEKNTSFFSKGKGNTANICYLVILLFPFGSSNFQFAGNDLLSGKIQKYYKQNLDRVEMIHQSKEPVCKVKPITSIPRSVFFKEIKQDTSFWVNKAMADFYGKERIELE